MTTTETVAPAATTASGSSGVKGNPWHPSLHGVALATWIELLRRRPSTKGYIVYGLTILAILGLGILVAVSSTTKLDAAPLELVLVLVLGAGMLIGPSLSATSINGDSSEGVLAPLQMTRLSAGDLALGKLLASWAVCVAALVTITPFLVYAYAKSGWHLGELASMLGVILLVVLAFTAMGLAWSSIAARAVASVSLTHLTTGMFALGTVLIFAFTAPLVSETVTITDHDLDYSQVTDQQADDPDFDYGTLPCIAIEEEVPYTHLDKTAWLLLLNPGVLIVESAPVINPETFDVDGRAAPGFFSCVHQGVSEARLPAEPPQGYDACTENGQATMDAQVAAQQKRSMETALMTPIPWPGLAVSVALLVGSMWIVIRRLRVPYRKLRTGTRVA